MPRTKRVIAVAPPDPNSFNPDRPLVKNTLLLHQVEHFQKVERERMTEGQASAYIRRMTKLLHPRTATAGGNRNK
jgi:hypothetical protein